MIQFLNNTHFDECLKISDLSTRHSGTSKNTHDDLTKCLNFERNTVLGYFENNKLITWTSARFGVLHQQKTWTILGMYTREFTDQFSFNRVDFGLSICKLFEIAEGDGYYDYVYSISTKLERVYDRKWASNRFLPPTARYTRQKIVEVPANTVPPEYWQQRLLGGIKPDDMSILKRSLKEEFRK